MKADPGEKLGSVRDVAGPRSERVGVEEGKRTKSVTKSGTADVKVLVDAAVGSRGDWGWVSHDS